MSPQVILKNISKVYYKNPLDMIIGYKRQRQGKAQFTAKDKLAVNNINLALSAGDRLGIIGRNGAGKSTLLSMIAGLTIPTTGTLTIEGKVTAVMTLGLGLREDLSGRDNIYIDGEIQGKTRQEIEMVIDEIIQFADLGKFIDYPLRTYSTGMKARLAFSMIINLDPEILIIDEALSAGDANFARKATQKMREICNKGKIVILVSHAMSSIVDMCNRCLWMEQGKVVLDGTPQDVTKAYIDAIKSEDENLLLEKFRERVGLYSLDGDSAITDFFCSQSGLTTRRNVFSSGEEISIHIAFKAQPDLLITLKLSVVRLDGLLILQSEKNIVVDPITLIQEYALQIPALPLAQGIYEIRAELMHDQHFLAKAVTVIEIHTHNPPSGGKPILIYPAFAHVME